MDPVVMLALAAGSFVLSHFVMSHPLRGAMVRGLGEQGFMGVYTLAVSYTHLDVYKRQFLPTTAFAAAQRRLGSGLSLHRAPIVSGGRCCPSSLYTCLLYTSRCV